AKEEGYKAGLNQVKEKVERFIKEMMNMSRTFKQIREEIVIKNEAIILSTMIGIIEKIIMEEYHGDIRIIKDMIMGVVKMTGEREDIEIRISKYDFDRIQAFS